MLHTQHRTESRLAAALRLMLLVIGTGLVVGIVAGVVFVGALTSAGR